MIEEIKDLGFRNGKRWCEFKCHCGNSYEARRDVVRFNDKHGKPNGCSRHCKKNNIISGPINEIVQIYDDFIEPHTREAIYYKDVVDGKWNDTMFNIDFNRFFKYISTGINIQVTSKDMLKKELKRVWIDTFRDRTDECEPLWYGEVIIVGEPNET